MKIVHAGKDKGAHVFPSFRLLRMKVDEISTMGASTRRTFSRSSSECVPHTPSADKLTS